MHKNKGNIIGLKEAEITKKYLKKNNNLQK